MNNRSVVIATQVCIACVACIAIIWIGVNGMMKLLSPGPATCRSDAEGAE